MPASSGTQGPLRRSPPAPVRSRLALPVPSLVSDRSIRGQRRCQERFSVKLTGLDASVESWLEAVRGAQRRGELLTAVDLAEQGLSEYPDDAWLKHAAVLALARAGATEEAARRVQRYGLGPSPEEDIAARAARLPNGPPAFPGW